MSRGQGRSKETRAHDIIECSTRKAHIARKEVLNHYATYESDHNGYPDMNPNKFALASFILH